MLGNGFSVVTLCYDEHHRTVLNQCMLERAVEAMVTGTTLVFKEDALYTRSIELNLLKPVEEKKEGTPKKDPKKETKKEKTPKKETKKKPKKTPKKEKTHKESGKSSSSSSDSSRSSSSSSEPPSKKKKDSAESARRARRVMGKHRANAWPRPNCALKR